ncbi:hypothetical protein [Mesorhizobium sp. M0053]|uniref:hypothetical protein n=1 Tax=Mesorhizobium sp. M0053 TaxID=2956864 RepID=UPI00333AD6C3
MALLRGIVLVAVFILATLGAIAQAGSASSNDSQEHGAAEGQKAPTNENAPPQATTSPVSQTNAGEGDKEVEKAPDKIDQFGNASLRVIEFIDAHEGFFLVVFTALLAVFTYMLRTSTDRLWKAGEEQKAISKKLADTAERQMLITGRQTDIIEKQHAIVRLQFISARDTAKKELRAYLTVEPDGINQLIGRMEVIGQVRLRNVGRLPARNVTLIVKMKLSALSEEDPRNRTKDFDASEDRTTYSDRVVNPGGDMLQGSEDNPPIAALAVEHYNMYVFGIAKYDNGYGDACWTRFCHRYSTDGRLKGLEMIDPPNATRSVIGREKARYHNYGNSAEPSESADLNPCQPSA